LRVAEERAAEAAGHALAESGEQLGGQFGSQAGALAGGLGQAPRVDERVGDRTPMNVLPGTEPQRLSGHEVTVAMVVVHSADPPVLLWFALLADRPGESGISPSGRRRPGNSISGRLAAMRLSG
jgi:hypothetical protein